MSFLVLWSNYLSVIPIQSVINYTHISWTLRFLIIDYLNSSIATDYVTCTVSPWRVESK